MGWHDARWEADHARHRRQRRGEIGGRAGLDRAAAQAVSADSPWVMHGFFGRNDLTFSRWRLY